MKTFLFRLLALVLLAVPSAAWSQRADSVYIEDRLNQLQQTITLMTGQIEQLQYRNQQLQQQMEKMQADYEYRLDALEKGKGAAGPRPAPAQTPPQQAPGAAPSANMAAAAGGNPDQLYNDGFKMFQDGDYAGAEKNFKAFVQRYPQHTLAANAQYWLAESYSARGDFQNAAIAFAEGYKVYKNSPKGPDNLLRLGVTLSRLGKKQEACAMFARFNQDYPKANDLQKRRVDQERARNGCG